ncbi:putative xyloglucan endotransglucosylase/hydrolase protein 32 isoform X1 [Primulina tabacum]|uniref:putative xyloglucan endotransglucosylase/hydrolase protein 32 isoform X1 n=1 Tax=Primulina tabacum TaxID=48773 RepID=UPI003F59CEA2
MDHLQLVSLLFLILMFPLTNKANVNGPPSPGYYPSRRIGSTEFDQVCTNLWGPQHQTLDQGTLTIWLDINSGSGFKSLSPYSSGYFGASVKLQSGYTAGVITSFYLSNNEDYPGNHDEIDIEFLGTTEDKPYVLQTNVYNRGSGDGSNIIGREVKFNLWFDPAKDFHNYAIFWDPDEIIFFVDDVPIRRYPRKNDDTFPARPMWVYGSIWDASSWATENGKYKADYSYQPFVSQYNNFKISGCDPNGLVQCRPVSGHPSRSGGLSRRQNATMAWAQNNYKVYDYCQDVLRDHSFTPEC